MKFPFSSGTIVAPFESAVTRLLSDAQPVEGLAAENHFWSKLGRGFLLGFFAEAPAVRKLMPTYRTILQAAAKDVKGMLLRSTSGAVPGTVIGGSFRHLEPRPSNRANSDLVTCLKFYVTLEKHGGVAELPSLSLAPGH
jgi:hypothetical protein